VSSGGSTPDWLIPQYLFSSNVFLIWNNCLFPAFLFTFTAALSSELSAEWKFPVTSHTNILIRSHLTISPSLLFRVLIAVVSVPTEIKEGGAFRLWFIHGKASRAVGDFVLLLLRQVTVSRLLPLVHRKIKACTSKKCGHSCHLLDFNFHCSTYYRAHIIIH